MKSWDLCLHFQIYKVVHHYGLKTLPQAFSSQYIFPCKVKFVFNWWLPGDSVRLTWRAVGTEKSAEQFWPVVQEEGISMSTESAYLAWLAIIRVHNTSLLIATIPILRATVWLSQCLMSCRFIQIFIDAFTLYDNEAIFHSPFWVHVHLKDLALPY